MGKGRASSSLFSFCNLFKACFSGGRNYEDSYSEEGYYIKRRICPSDEGYYEPGIDGKASDFIARFHGSRSDAELET